MDNIHLLNKAWSDVEFIDRFRQKTTNEFFDSERYFVAKIATKISSVLDVGCASGTFFSFLKEFGYGGDYVGIDFSRGNIEQAAKSYPSSTFVCTDALDFEPKKRFDLVNATGVFQHEPRFNQLLLNMLQWSNRYVLFDIKLRQADDHLIDIKQSYRTTNDPNVRINFNIHSFTKIIEHLKHLEGIESVGIYGYYTSINSQIKAASDISRIISAGVLIEKGQTKEPKVKVELPSEFLNQKGAEE